MKKGSFWNFSQKMTLKSASKQNIIASKYQNFTWKFSAKFKNFSSVGGGCASQNPGSGVTLFYFEPGPVTLKSGTLHYLGTLLISAFNTFCGSPCLLCVATRVATSSFVERILLFSSDKFANLFLIFSSAKFANLFLIFGHPFFLNVQNLPKNWNFIYWS